MGMQLEFFIFRSWQGQKAAQHQLQRVAEPIHFGVTEFETQVFYFSESHCQPSVALIYINWNNIATTSQSKNQNRSLNTLLSPASSLGIYFVCSFLKQGHFCLPSSTQSIWFNLRQKALLTFSLRILSAETTFTILILCLNLQFNFFFPISY